MFDNSPRTTAHIIMIFAALLLAACMNGDGDAVEMTMSGSTGFDNPVRAGVAVDDHLFLVHSGETDGDVVLNAYTLNDDGIPGEVAGSLAAPGSGYSTIFATSGGLAIEDGVAYIPLAGQERSGLWIVDVTEPAAPEELDFLETQDVVQSVAVEDDLAAVSGMLGSTIFLVDVADPASTEILSEHPFPAVSSTQLALDGDHLFVSDISGVAVFDVASPEAPTEISVIENDNYGGPGVAGEEGSGGSGVPAVPQVAVVDDYLYLTDAAVGLTIFDISDPGQPEMANEVEMELGAVALEVSGDEAFALGRGQVEPGMAIGDIPYALQRLDISDPDDPRLIDEVTEVAGPPSPVQSLSAGGDFIYFLNFQQVDVIGAS